jgi:nicotinamidase-related amidase
MNDYITSDREHSALLIIDVQRDFTIMGATAEVPGTLQAIQYIQRLAQVYI